MPLSQRTIRGWTVGLAVVLVAVLVGGPPAAGQGDPTIRDVIFTHYSNNPVLARDLVGTWDSGFVSAPAVIYADGVFHLFYVGGSGTPYDSRGAVGYATSTDGLVFTRHPANPVLAIDPAVEGRGVGAVVALHEGANWILYLNLRPSTGQEGFGAGFAVLRATAPEPIGPWTLDAAPALPQSAPASWDTWIAPASVVRTPDSYRLYYTGWGTFTGLTGMATSTDGLTWFKTDDPNTARRPFDESDPTFWSGQNGAWDSALAVTPVVLHDGYGWLMFYSGGSSSDPDVEFFRQYRTGLATSVDGITWERYGDAPILAGPEGFPGFSPWVTSAVLVDGTVYLYYTIVPRDETDYGFDIGVATGVIVRGAPAIPTEAFVGWQYIALGDSSVFPLVEGFAQAIRQDLGVAVQVNNHSRGDQHSATIASLLRADPNLRAALRDAEVVTVLVPPEMFRRPLADHLAGTCGTDHFECLRAAQDLFLVDVSTILAQIQGLVPPGTPIRLIENFSFFQPWSGLSPELRGFWTGMIAELREVAREAGVPVVPTFEALHGPGGTLDPVAQGYLTPDSMQLTESGQAVILGLLRGMGYE